MMYTSCVPTVVLSLFCWMVLSSLYLHMKWYCIYKCTVHTKGHNPHLIKDNNAQHCIIVQFETILKVRWAIVSTTNRYSKDSYLKTILGKDDRSVFYLHEPIVFDYALSAGWSPCLDSISTYTERNQLASHHLFAWSVACYNSPRFGRSSFNSVHCCCKSAHLVYLDYNGIRCS